MQKYFSSTIVLIYGLLQKSLMPNYSKIKRAKYLANREAILIRQKAYRQAILDKRKKRSELLDFRPEQKRYIRRSEEGDDLIDERYLEVIEVYCTDFACGKELTRTEKLAGNKCLKHQVYIRKIF